MRILQLITQTQLRGAEVFAAQLSDALATRGHEVVLAALRDGHQTLSTLPQVRQVVLGGGGSASRLPISPSVWRSLCRLVKDFRPDVVQANGSETLKYAALLRLRYPWVRAIYRNISIMSMWSDSGLKRHLVGAALRRMDHVASVTQVGKGDLVNGFGVAEDRVSVIPIGVHVPAELSPEERDQVRESVRRRFGLPDGCPLVTHVGSFTAEKNHRELLQAFASAVREIPSSRLLLVGDGPLRPQIESMVRDSGLEGSVVLAGVVPDAAGVMAGADVLALPSLREGLPGVILEAAVAGVPAVAYRVGGVPEVVEDGVTGLVVALGDVQALGQGMVRLLGNPPDAHNLGAAARSLVATQYALFEVGVGFETVYTDLVGYGVDRAQ